MSEDWIATLQEQGDFARRMAADALKILDHPDLTLDQASRLYRAVEEGAQTFDSIIEKMRDDRRDLGEALFEAAESLENMWSSLSIEAANKVRIMQGLDAIELSYDED
jgi:hypothetical protein